MPRHFKYLTLLLLLSITGCYYDVEETLYPNSFCDLEAVSWTNTIQPIVQAKCATPGCHVPGGNGTGDFTTYAGFKTKVDQGAVRVLALELMTMPPSAPLSDCNKQQLALWLDAGAPNN